MVNIETSKENIEWLIRLVEGAFGSDFIYLIEHYPNQTKTLTEKALLDSKEHPFASWWNAINQDLSLFNKLHRLSSNSILFLNLAVILESISDVKGINRIIEDMRNPGKFYSTIYEASTAAQYKLSGYEVEILEERSIDSLKTCDLKVVKDSKSIFIECKSLDDLSRREANKWDKFSMSILELLNKRRKCWKVEIYPNDIVDHNDLEGLRRSIKLAINSDETISRIDGKKISLKISKLMDWGDHQCISMNIDKSAMFHQFLGSIIAPHYLDKAAFLQRNFESITSTNCCEVWVAPFQRIPESKSVLYAFKTARKQLPQEYPSLIYINVPSKKGIEFLRFCDNSFDSLYAKLNRDTTRVNAVVLTGTIQQMKNSLRPLAYHHCIVPNFNAKHVWPSEFKIVGVRKDKGTKEINPFEGTIFFECRPDEGWKVNVSTTLFEYVTDDGKFQLIFWKTWNDTFRMEILSEKIGRKYAESEKIDFTSINENDYLKFAGSWSNKELKLFLNRKQIAAAIV